MAEFKGVLIPRFFFPSGLMRSTKSSNSYWKFKSLSDVTATEALNGHVSHIISSVFTWQHVKFSHIIDVAATK